MSELSEAVSRRIRGLLSKTVENGATEAEAMAAAAKARELMDRYRLSMTDVEIQAEPVVQEVIDRPIAMKTADVDYCLGGIQVYCGVKTWYTRRVAARKLAILGLKADVEMARYLYEMIRGAIEVEVEAYRKTPEYRSLQGPDQRATRAAMTSFRVGMAGRVNDRLKQMARDLEPVAKTATGTALVVVKGALVEDAFAKLGLKFGKATMGMRATSYNAYGAGQAAGNRVNLSRPVSSTNTRRISGRGRDRRGDKTTIKQPRRSSNFLKNP